MSIFSYVKQWQVFNRYINKLLIQYHYNMIISRHLIFALYAILIGIGSNSVSADSHYVPGMGTYGVSNEKHTCSVCGKTFTAGEGHVCERPERSSSHTRSSGSSAEDRAAAANIANDPSLLVNQTHFNAVDYNQYQAPDEGNGSEASRLLHDFMNGDMPKKSHTTRNVIIALLIAGGAIWLYRRKK